MSTRGGDAMQRHQRAKKKKSEGVMGVGNGTLGARAVLTALKKGAYLQRGRTSWTASITMEDDGASSGLIICYLYSHRQQTAHRYAAVLCTGEEAIMLGQDTKKDVTYEAGNIL